MNRDQKAEPLVRRPAQDQPNPQEFFGAGEEGLAQVLKGIDDQFVKERELFVAGKTHLLVIVRVDDEALTPSVFAGGIHDTQLASLVGSHAHCQVGEAAMRATADLLGSLVTRALEAHDMPPDGEIGH